MHAHSLLALALAVAAVVIASRWGEALLADGVRMKIHTPPLRGPTDWRPGWSAVPAVALAAVAIAALPPAIARLGLARAVLLASGVAVLWAVALAWIDGPAAFTDPLVRHQYLRTVPRVGDPIEFLRTFSDRLPTYNIHTQGHPPGMVMVLWALDRIGLGGVGPNAWLVFLGGGAGVAAAAVGIRDVAGDDAVRRVLPFLALAPGAIWWTSADAFFTAIGAAAVTCVVVATGRRGQVSDRWAIAGGLLFAATAFLSYGLVLLACVPGVVAVRRRRIRPLVIAGVVAVCALLLVAATTGFAYWEGLLATRERYFAGVASQRPYSYFLVANLAAFVLMVGPAAIAGLTRLRNHAVAPLVVGAVAAVLLADLSGMSKAEVERIWLPFVPWVVAATAALGAGRVSSRRWLIATAALTLLVAVGVRSPW